MSNSPYVTGLRAVEQLLSSQSAEIKKIYAEYQSANPRVEEIIRQAKLRGVDIQAANRARLKQISGEARHQGVVAEIRRSSVLDEADLRTFVEAQLEAEDSAPLLILILDSIQDPHNLGACLRTADAAGVDAVVIPRHGAASLGATVSKVAAGGAENQKIAQVPNIVRILTWLADYGVHIVGTSDAATGKIFGCKLEGPLAIVMGGEHKGLRKGVADKCSELASLPMNGVVESLNVSVATGICLYEALRQRADLRGQIKT
jgi:23S rRNA (guanosine2251-2'-O)-methyltransferase